MKEEQATKIGEQRVNSPDGSGAFRPECWLDEHGDALFAFAFSRIRDRAAAEDLVQDAFAAALANLDGFSGNSSLRTWLTAILRRKIYDYYRDAARKGFSELATDLPDGSAESAPRGHQVRKRWRGDPAWHFEQREFWRVFDDCREKLPTTLAGAFVMREMDGLTTEEVCQILGISASNLSVRIFRARALLRQCLEDRWFAREGK